MNFRYTRKAESQMKVSRQTTAKSIVTHRQHILKRWRLSKTKSSLLSNSQVNPSKENDKKETKELIKEPSTSRNNKPEPKGWSNKSSRSTFIAEVSILKHLNGHSLSGYYSDVQVSSFPGCTTSDMADHIRPLVRRQPDFIIIHVGTKSMRNATSASALKSSLTTHGCQQG